MEPTIILVLAGLAAILGAFMIQKYNIRKLSLLLIESQNREKAAGKREENYRAMLPGGLLKLFWTGSPENPVIGEEKSIKAVALSYNISEFSKLIRQESAEEIFRFVNDVLSLVVPSILYQEGEIEKYKEAGLSAFFLGDPERALHSAVSVCEALNQAGIQETYSIGLTYGDIMVGMVGHEKRFGTLMISETTGLADFLQELAVRFRSRILITGDMKKQIPGFDKSYNSRYLGNIYVKAAGTTEEIYDVYDGDEPEDKNGKRKTRMLFENGVALFQNKNFQDARLHFIEVLKANRMDGAAKEYLYLCNKCISNEVLDEDVISFLDVY